MDIHDWLFYLQAEYLRSSRIPDVYSPLISCAWKRVEAIPLQTAAISTISTMSAITVTPVCRSACAACCTAPSISSPIPGMPKGKPAGVPCIQLDPSLGCKLFDHPDRPAVCASLKPSLEMCGETREQALSFLQKLEAWTAGWAGTGRKCR